MPESEDLKNAIDDFVDSLEEEQKNNKLIEDSSKKKDYKQSGGFFTLVAKLKKIIEMTCIGEEIRVETDEKKYSISVYGKDLSVLVGKNGQEIEALEQIINLIGRKKNLIEKRIVLDIKDYRKNNIVNLETLAMKMANKAVKENKKITLKPMPSYERKIVHNLLSKINGVKTHSKYDEPNRRIIISPVAEKKQ